jgi:hypothetical protein
MSSVYFDVFLYQISQERSSLCTLETVYSNVVDCILILRHALYKIMTYHICLIFRRVEMKQGSKALLIPSVLNTAKLDKLAKALPELLIVLQ